MTHTAISVTMGLFAEHDGFAAGQATDTHLVVELVPRGEGIEHLRPPLSVVFALDVSGSMDGPPLEHVQGSVEMLLDLLDPHDMAGVVGFSDDASEIAPLRPLDRTWNGVVKSRVRRLMASGCTNMWAGLMCARDMLGKRREHERQLIVLLSDGLPNRGISDTDGLVEIASSMRPDVVTVTLGYGPHHAEDLLARIAEAGSGEYFYVADPLEADDAFARAVGAQGDVVADAVEIAFRPAAGVEIVGFSTPARPRFGPRGLIIHHPDLLAGRARYIVAELRLTTPRHTGPWPGLEVELEYRAAGSTNLRSTVHTLQIPVKRRDGELVPQAHMRVLLAEAESARAEARHLADRGQYDGAAATLRALIEKLEKAPGFSPGDGSVLADALEQLVDERIAYERRPSLEQYRAFKRMNMGVDMQAGGWHHIDRQLASRKAADIVIGSQGALPAAHLLVESPDGNRQHVDLTGETTIGRGASNTIVLGQGVSKRHTRIVGRDGKYMVIDLKSTNGTRVNGRWIDAPHILQPDDTIAIGDFLLYYRETRPANQADR